MDGNKTVKVTRLILDSRRRNPNFYPNPNSFIINLDETIYNIVKIELCHAFVQFNATTDQDDYIIIKIIDLEHIVGVNNNDPVDKSFAIVNKNTNYTTPLNIYRKEFIIPYNLSRVDIKCYNKNGELYDFENKNYKFEILIYSLDRKI